MTCDAVIFDYGNTLVSYWTRAEWPGLLARAIGEVTAFVSRRGLMRVNALELPGRVEAERGESKDHRVVPLEDRLRRIFRLTEPDLDADGMRELCGCFLAPLLARARPCDDVPPALAELRRRGMKTGIVSNLPWGSPAALWRVELARHGLLDAVDAVVFCSDAGYRKPAPEPFRLVLSKLGVAPERSLFVGDDPRWDVAGPQALGMDALLIDRTGTNPDAITKAAIGILDEGYRLSGRLPELWDGHASERVVDVLEGQVHVWHDR